MYADRAGRKKAMILTLLLLMALGTATIAVAPTFAQIGNSPRRCCSCSRACCRVRVGRRSWRVDHAAARTGAAASPRLLRIVPVLEPGSAALAGALTGVALTSTLNAAQLESWGWRVPFIIGTLFVPLGYRLRRTVEEVPAAAPAAAHDEPVASLPLADVLRHHGKPCSQA